jgi:anti-sigma factor RsiW
MIFTCAALRARADEYVSGELAGDELAAFQSHLGSCASCRADVEDDHRFSAAVRSAYRPNEAPASLRDGIQLATASIAPGPRWRRSLPALASSVALALVVSTATLWVSDPAHGESLPELATVHHESVLAGKMPLDLVSSNPEQIIAWAGSRTSFGLQLPRLDSPDLDLVGARLFEASGTLAVFVLYKKGNEPIGLAIAPEQVRGGPSPAAAATETFRNIRFDFHNFHGFNVISWVDGGRAYSLVSKLPSEGRASCTVCHAEGSGLSDIREFHNL